MIQSAVVFASVFLDKAAQDATVMVVLNSVYLGLELTVCVLLLCVYRNVLQNVLYKRRRSRSTGRRGSSATSGATRERRFSAVAGAERRLSAPLGGERRLSNVGGLEMITPRQSGRRRRAARRSSIGDDLNSAFAPSRRQSGASDVLSALRNADTKGSESTDVSVRSTGSKEAQKPNHQNDHLDIITEATAETPNIHQALNTPTPRQQDGGVSDDSTVVSPAAIAPLMVKHV
uniref:Uncharacterized protein n=1 Tax=Lotharella globosa TaxID=91324 RepID=A0A7S3ZF95_9EUKA